jgi:two-component system, OmpR family, sensor kinase
VIWRWVGALLPLGLGVMVGLLTLFEIMPNPILYLRADFGTMAVLSGGLASGILLSSLYVAQRQRQRLAQIQAEATAERKRFLQRLDHELKNPLTAIRAGVANLDATTESVRRTAVNGIEKDIIYLSRLVSELRKLVELENRSLDATRVDTAELLREVVAVVQEPCGDAEIAGVQLTLTLPKAPWPIPAICGDPDLLFLAVHNVVQNALKFTHAGDTVEVRALEDGAAVIIEVADTGMGIAEQDLPHIWEELYRGKNAQDAPGSGLGLALARTIVERHGGQVRVRSRIGQGTLVSLRLPAQ